MILISVIIALVIERLAAKEEAWQLSTYVKHYISVSKTNSLFSGINKNKYMFLLWLLLPIVLLYALRYTFDFVLIELVINVIVLLVCFGCAYFREQFKGYLNALQRQDSEAATLYALQLGQKRTEKEGGETLGQTIAWINFRHYGAVVFWFTLLGPCGALGYALIREFADITRYQKDSPYRPHKKWLHKLMYWADWLPARIISFGYLIIGNFNQGTSTYLKYVFNFNVPNRCVIGDIAHAAERVEQAFIGCTFEAKCMVRLVKRNMLLMLAAIAILTLLGAVG